MGRRNVGLLHFIHLLLRLFKFGLVFEKLKRNVFGSEEYTNEGYIKCELMNFTSAVAERKSNVFWYCE
jgi:hypothetical protein